MKKLTVALTAIAASAMALQAETLIRVNSVGYLTDDSKVAVLLSHEPIQAESFTIINVANGNTVSLPAKSVGEYAPFASTARLDFSSVTEPGSYRIEAAGAKSPIFRISDDAYVGLNEIPLRYMRQQRCGYNPFLRDSCHRHDGVVVLHPTLEGQHIDVTGGWHDASDYLQYLTTSANATYQMLFAYSMNPEAWADEYDAAGNPGANGIPDILDEARWGLEWMVKMNPDSATYFNQIADDRDHRMAQLPTGDKVDYGWGDGAARPIYPCYGAPYGLQKYKNRSRGLASSVGKYASSFSLGSQLFSKIDPQFAADIAQRSANAYAVAKANPGECQTACCVSPYFYEEDNWADDMELAAIEMFKATGDRSYLTDAIGYGRIEPVTPWMGADSARHYQWYPFVNIGHFQISRHGGDREKQEFVRNMRSGLSRVADRAEGNPFCNGVPGIWCSNNLTVGLITQAMLYRQLTGDEQFREMETSLRDWLFGVNPWGKTMIIGIRPDVDYPKDPHSAFTNLHQYPIDGGLVDGPVYASIFNSLWGVHLRNEDRYAAYQGGQLVYHDDYNDYSTNEPTMDGTASLTYMLSVLASAESKHPR
ncbi:MAG: glycoside hydrolase family 9 protein [Bacteroidales bacterium]|nr:glycoside hydrolase family 9 protein [Bacteroidales bacterium]